jgi:adenosylcobinamide-phosphate synthase
VAVSRIVGRDPEALDEAGVCRAAIESTAENFSDGIVAPAFWYLIAGLPGILAYKAVNTADSMIGHRSDRYRAFGWAAARLDDLLNYIPARISGALLTAAAPAVGGSAKGALNAMLRDARKHRSANAGWPEAAMAGALGLALAGPRIYASGRVEDAWMNASGRPNAKPSDIASALRLLVATCLAHAFLVAVVGLIAQLL